jgi:P27 family predicted phage terminase small subunit
MARGRKSKPTELKLLEGNPGKRRINKREPKPKAANPDVPSGFSMGRWVPREAGDKDSKFKAPVPAKEAAALFVKLKTELQTLGLLTDVDVEMLELYCQAYGYWREASAYVNRYGMVMKGDNGYYQSPYLSIANKQAAIMAKIAAEFGFTPSSRTGLEVPQKGDDDPMSLLLSRAK